MIKIKQILRKITGYCWHCGKYFKYPQKRPLNTCYENEVENYSIECKECHQKTIEYYEAMWQEYNSSRF